MRGLPCNTKCDSFMRYMIFQKGGRIQMQYTYLVFTSLKPPQLNIEGRVFRTSSPKLYGNILKDLLINKISFIKFRCKMSVWVMNA